MNSTQHGKKRVLHKTCCFSLIRGCVAFIVELKGVESPKEGEKYPLISKFVGVATPQYEPLDEDDDL